MSEMKKRKLRKAELKKLKLIEKRERQNNLWKRNDIVPEEESSVEDSSEPETYEQKKKRENIEDYHVIRHLSGSQRRKRIIEKT